MKIKTINLKQEKSAFKILTDSSDICIIPDVKELTNMNELYNSKWIVNCHDDEDNVIKILSLAEELRPKQLFITNFTTTDKNLINMIKSWRGTILNRDDVLELTNKPDEGLFFDFNPDLNDFKCFGCDKRFRIEGREFILCLNNYAYGRITIGQVRKTDNEFIYEIAKFEPFAEAKLLEGLNQHDMFIENIEDYYFENKMKSMTDTELKALIEIYNEGEKYAVSK